MDQFTKVENKDLLHFREICGEEFVYVSGEIYDSYTHDYTEDLSFFPEVVLRPANKEEISSILKYCNSRAICLTPAGARTGLSGGMLAVNGGVSLATDRLNQVLNIDEGNLQVTTQPAVITQLLMDQVAAKGLFYPVDPASRGSCFIGGNIAESSGGMRAVKYGITRDYVLDLEVVLPNGEIIRTGAKTLKNSTGYNLTQLFVGSEGTLGVITEATLKLRTLPGYRNLLLAPFASGEQACRAVSAIFLARILPSAIEFMEKDAIDHAQAFLGEQHFDTEGIEAHLLIEIDGNSEEILMQEAEQLYEVLTEHGAGEILFAQSEDEQNRLWKIRRTIGEATRAKNIVKEEDTCVPRAQLAELWKFIKGMEKKHDLQVFCFGHAGDGNLHVHIPIPPEGNKAWHARADKAIREIFTETVRLGGVISGEHGIGWVQKAYMDINFSGIELELMRNIKKVFDPKGILNPGKIFPS